MTTTVDDEGLRWPFRSLGLLPLLFFALQYARHRAEGRPGDSLWMCHISNLSLALGLLAGWPVFIRIGGIWLILGLPLWILDMLQTGDGPPSSFLAHLGGLIVGLWAIRQVGWERHAWLKALLWFLFWQQLCKWVTSPELNVNLAHDIRDGRSWFGAYWQYWLVTTILAGLVLWGIGLGLGPSCSGKGGQGGGITQKSREAPARRE